MSRVVQDQSFADQLAELLKQADDPYYRMINGLSQAIAILQDGQRQAVDAAVEHLIDVIQPPPAPIGQQPPPLTEQQRLDQEFHAARQRARVGVTH